MRTERAIALSPGRDAVVMEARVQDMRRLMELLPTEGESVDWLALARDRLPDLVALLSGCLRLPVGETVDDLSVSECERVLLAWWEMHADFFLRLLAALGLEVASSASGNLPTSTAPASGSASADSITPGHSAGDFSRPH